MKERVKQQDLKESGDAVQNRINTLVNGFKKGQVDYKQIFSIGRTHGFLNEENRKEIWPLLLGLNINKIPKGNVRDEDKKSNFYDQLRKDIDRSIAFLDRFQDKKQDIIKKKQQQLFIILEGLMQKQPELQYYQGYHDVATLFLLIFGTTEGYYMTERAANTFFRDPLIYPLEQSAMIQLKIIHKLVKEDDASLGKILDEIDGPMFSISWILTWFAHTFTDLNKIQRIFDYLLCSEPQTISYLSAALILTTKDQLQEKLVECEEGTQIGVVFQFYQNANLNEINIDFDKWFNKCQELEQRYKFEMIRKEHNNIPQDSNLYEEHFNKMLEFRKEMKKNKVVKLIGGISKVINLKSVAFTIVSAAVLFYTVKHLNIRIFSKDITRFSS